MSIMLTRQEVAQGTVDEWEQFAELIAGLDEAQWTAPTRCEGWEVRDVAAHVVGTVSDAVVGKVGHRSPEQEAAEGRHLGPREMAAELRRAAAKVSGLLGALDDAAWAGPSPSPD